MSHNPPSQPWIGPALAALLVLFLAGCGSEGSDDRFSENGGSAGGGGNAGFEGTGGSGAPTNGVDSGGFADNPVDLLFADPQRNPSEILGGVGTDASGAESYAAAARACYGSPEACGASHCQAFASCCVNSGSCCAPIVDQPSVPALLDFRSCAGKSLAACAADTGSTAVAFGPSEPVLNARGLVPNGTATAEGGAIIGEPLDLSSERVEIDVRFSLPVACGSTCLQSAGVAFSSEEPGLFVDAEVGLLLSGSRDVVNLMIGNAVAASFDARSNSTQWRLVLSPQGSAEVFRDGISQGAHPFDAATLQRAQLVAFGRNLGATSESAAIAVLGVESSICDSPRAWSERAPVSVTRDGNELPGHAFGRKPSIVDLGLVTLVAYELGGEIFVAEQSAPAALTLRGSKPALIPTEPLEAMGVGDPELLWDGSALFLFYTARDESGAGSIHAAVSAGGAAEFVKRDAPILLPADDVVSFDAPSVVFRDGLWLLVVRATLASGATELRAFYTSALETGWARIIHGGLELLTRVDSPGAELSDPSLIVHNSAYQLYFSRRTGTRWSVELAVSDELLLWRSLGEVLGPSEEGFDRLGARAADAASGPDRVDVVYSGQDGVSFRLGTASRTAPSTTAPGIF